MYVELSALIHKYKRFGESFNPDIVVSYYYNKKAWMCSEVSVVLSFRLFYFSTHCDLLQVFTDWSKKENEQFMSQQCNCLMLLDNASSNRVEDTLLTKVGSLDAFRLNNFLLLFLPPNCTSVVLPLDQGIIAAFKARYKGKLACYMVQYDIDSSQNLQALSLKTNLKQVCVLFYL